MSHLTKAEPKGIFECNVPERPRDGQQEAGCCPSPFGPMERTNPVAVGVDMTPEQAAETRRANYPRYDWPSVENLPPRSRSRGHSYE